MSNDRIIEWSCQPLIDPTAVVVEKDGETVETVDVEVGEKASVRFDRREYHGDGVDVSPGDRVTYYRLHSPSLPATVTNVRGDGYVDLVIPDGDDLREVSKVPPKQPGIEENGFKADGGGGE